MSGIAFCYKAGLTDSVIEDALNAVKPSAGHARMGMSSLYTEINQLPTAYEDCRAAFESPSAEPNEQSIITYQPFMQANPMRFNITLKQQTMLAGSLALGNEAETIACLDAIGEDNKGLNLYWQRRMYGYLADLLIVFSHNQGVGSEFEVDMSLPWSGSYNPALLKRWIYVYYRKLAEKARQPAGDSQLSNQIREYVDKNLSQEITLAQIAEHVNKSYGYVSSQFSETYGINFSTYLLSRRMHKARELLTGTDLAVSAVALECGYYAPSSFIRTFKKENGMPPGAYREMTQRKANGA
jgi:AraC-like DNA-binding protein